MLAIRYSQAAKVDLQDIGHYLETRMGKAGARVWLKRIRARAQALKLDGPSFREREELGPGRRAVNVGPWMIFYRISNGTLLVQRILRGSRQIRPELLDEC